FTYTRPLTHTHTHAHSLTHSLTHTHTHHRHQQGQVKTHTHTHNQAPHTTSHTQRPCCVSPDCCRSFVCGVCTGTWCVTRCGRTSARWRASCWTCDSCGTSRSCAWDATHTHTNMRTHTHTHTHTHTPRSGLDTEKIQTVT